MRNKNPGWLAIGIGMLLLSLIIVSTIAVSAIIGLHNHKDAIVSLREQVTTLEKILGGVDGYSCIEWANRTTKDLVGPYIDVECCVNETCGYMLEHCRIGCDADSLKGKSVVTINGIVMSSKEACLKDCDVREYGCREDCQIAYNLNPETAERFEKCLTPISLITKTETICTKKIPYFDDETVYATEQRMTALEGARPIPTMKVIQG